MANNNLYKNLEETIILDSLSLLGKEEGDQLKSEFSNSTSDVKKFANEFNNLTSLFPKILNTFPKESFSFDTVKEKLLNKIKSQTSLKKESDKKKVFDFIYADTSDWIKHEIEGIKVKTLSVNEEKNYVMLMMQLAANTQYPAHHHSGAEECYVLEGDLYAEGKILGPGDFHHAEGGSSHEPLHTKNGCTVLLVVDSRDY